MSFGKSYAQLSKDYIDTVSDYLKKLSAVSVRENSGVDRCRNIFKYDNVTQILDPIFFCDFQEYLSLFSTIKKDLSNKFLLCYILDPSHEKEQIAKYIAEKFNLHIVTIFGIKEYKTSINKWRIGTVAPQLSVEEFLFYFNNSSYVFTDSHHGTCLAIIFKKDYLSFVNKNRGEDRFYTVAKTLNLMERLIYSYSDLSAQGSSLFKHIDYDNVYTIIKKEKARAINWLNNAFEKEESNYKTDTINTLRQEIFRKYYNYNELQNKVYQINNESKFEVNMVSLFRYIFFKLLSKITSGDVRKKIKKLVELERSRIITR